MSTQPTATAAGTIEIGGDLTVNRLGFGAMRITGRGIWGEPPSRDQAIATLRRVVELGVNFIDTADSYGPAVSEDADRRGAAPVPGRPGDRDQGRPGPARPEPLGSRRAPRAPAGGVRGQPAAAPARADPALPVPPARPGGPAGRVDGRDRRAEGGGQDPPRRHLQRVGGRAPRGAADRPDRVGAEPVQRDRPALAVADRPVRAGAAGVPALGAGPGEPSRRLRWPWRPSGMA